MGERKSMEQPAKTVLVVEDDEILSEMITLALLLVIPTVHPVVIRNGLEALAWIRGHNPDLILLDYLLPGMDGLTLFDRLRREDPDATLPIILMSASLSPQVIAERKILFLPKPFELDTFLALVESHLLPNSTVELLDAPLAVC
jgi:CheY-like chemotaxis protein